MAFKILMLLPLGALFVFFPEFGRSMEIRQTAVGELFTYKIEPMLFNWTHQVISEQFRYRATLGGYPDLPHWMRYMYSLEHHAGFLYGTPPDSYAGKNFRLDLLALNRQNYETRYSQLEVFVGHKFPLTNVVQMKIDNLNWVHLMDPGRVENLRNIFRNDLWPESGKDLSLIFMESAVNMGGRLPLRPQQREGVVVHLASSAQFSNRLTDLQEEVRPLYKLPSCTYKRTSVQNVFENSGFKLDWCAFKMTTIEITPEILFHNHGPKTLNHDKINNEINLNLKTNRWYGISRDEAPQRNYIDEFAFALAIPGVILALLVGILSVIFCFQHERLTDPKSEFFFQNIFHICEESCEKPQAENETNETISYMEKSIPFEKNASTVQMVQCSDTNTTQPITTLKSLKDPQCLLDNISMRSQSPSHFYQADNPSNAFVRPKPPPYKGNTLTKSKVDI